MANFVFNIAKGKAGQYFQNVDDNSPASCRIVVIPIETTGLEAAATMKDYDTVSALLAGTSNEQSTMGRKFVSTGANITCSVDDTNDLFKCDIADITWTAATGNAISGLVLAYDPTGASADTALVPLTFHDFVVTPDGSDITADVTPANGVYQAS
jgi:hypothetical protein